MPTADLVGLSLERARAALAEGDGDGAIDWLRLVPDRPRSLEAAAQSPYQERLALVRKRQSGLSDETWHAVLPKNRASPTSA